MKTLKESKCGIRAVIFNNLTKRKNELWFKMHDMQVKFGVKNMPDLVRKEVHGISDNKNPTEEQIWDYKTWFDDGLYIIETLVSEIIMHCRLS